MLADGGVGESGWGRRLNVVEARDEDTGDHGTGKHA